MTELWQRFKQRKLVQWAVAYAAGAWVLLQVLDMAGNNYDWPHAVMRIALGVAALGFLVTLLLAWYHGERGAQKVSGTELLILSALFAVGGFLIWRFAPSAPMAVAVPAAVTAPASHATPSTDTASAALVDHKSIAVLPFENLSADKDNEYFASGMQDMILTKLSAIGELAVISRTSTQRYASHPESLREIGQQLGVATILEGSVQKSKDRVLINVQLIDAATDRHLWAESYTHKLDDVFAVEGEVAQKVADALKLTLLPAQAKALAAAPTRNPEAYDLFLHAEYLRNRAMTNNTIAGIDQAIDLYQKAIDKDPDFALAYARMSYAQSFLFWRGGSSTRPVGDALIHAAQASAERALALAPDLADGHQAMGYFRYWIKLDFTGATQSFERALALRPNDSRTRSALGYLARRQGRWQNAIEQLKAAVAIDPRDSELLNNLGVTYGMVRDYAQAMSFERRALAVDPDNHDAQIRYATVLVIAKGDLKRAMAVAAGDDTALKLQRVFLLSMQGDHVSALHLLREIPDDSPEFGLINGSRSMWEGLLLSRSGDRLTALPLLRQARTRLQADIDKQPAGSSGVVYVLGLLGDVELALGDEDAAFAAVRKAVALVPPERDALSNLDALTIEATLYARAGRADLAVPRLAHLLSAPGAGLMMSRKLLAVSRDFDPIRRDPRFQALLEDRDPSQKATAH